MDKYSQLKRLNYDLRLQLYMYAFMYVDTNKIPVEDYFTYTSSSFYSRPVSVSLWRVHSSAVVFHTLHRGQRDTRLCTYLLRVVL